MMENVTEPAAPRRLKICDTAECNSALLSLFRNHRVAVLVGRSAAAEQAQGFTAGVPELVFLARRNRDGVADPHLAHFAFDADPSGAVRDVINLLGARMKMFLRARAHRQTRF